MATIDGEITTVPTAPRPARPDWRRQRHTWFLAALAAANVVFDGLMGHLIAVGSSSTEAIVIGILLGQLFLMGLWMALGGLHVAARFAAVAAMTIFGSTAFWLGLGQSVGELRNLLTYSGVVVLATHALLLPLRALLGWRIDFDQAYHARSADKALQLRLVHLIAFTTACAPPFALARGADDTNALLTVFVFGGIGLVASIPIAWIAVAERRSLRFWSTAGGMLFVSLFVDLFVVAETMHADFDSALVVYLGVVATVAVNLVALRVLFGLRLFSILGPAAPSGAAIFYDSLDPDLAAIVNVWPRLPEAMRRELAKKICSALQPTAQQDACEETVERVAST